VADWRHRFEQFSKRKREEAIRAVLPPYVTVLDHHDPAALTIGNPWSRALFGGDFHATASPDGDRPACSLVFVQSKDGNTGTRNPSTLGGGDTDKHLIYEGLSRVSADGVLAGAGTIRGRDLVFSVWHPELVALRESLGKPRHPIQIVATLGGLDVDSVLIFNVPDVPVVLLTVFDGATLMRGAVASRPWITPIVMDGPGDLGQAFVELRARGIERVSGIGGRRIARQLIDADLVQDVYLTTAPRPGGEPNTPMSPKPVDGWVSLRKHGTAAEIGVVFEHLVVGRREGAHGPPS
jgi:riboflavin biosynthesis pyrimidine reductase